MKISDILDTIETSSIGNLSEEIEEIDNLIANSSKITMDNIKDLNYFFTTKFLDLADGSKIKRGTEFIIDRWLNNGMLELHFCCDEENHYKNDCGDEYFFSIDEIKEFSKPTKFAVDEYKQRVVVEVEECIKDLKKATNLLKSVKTNIAAEKCTDNFHIKEENMSLEK